MAKKAIINEEVDAFYTQSSEEERLNMGLGPLEFERNQKLIKQFLPTTKASVIDVGGGTGKYAEWLSNMGHSVTLVEPVTKHIKIAQKRSKKLQNPFSILQGEARHLEVKDNSADLVILHGPLYHLQDREDRIKVILEAKRITKPGGYIVGFAINYTASTFVALLQGLLHQPDIFEMVTSELSSGIHEAPKSMPGVLAKAYYHRPEELIEEFEECKLDELDLFAVEGISWLEKNFFTTRADKKKYNNLLKVLELTEKDKNLIAVSPHMMLAGRKS